MTSYLENRINDLQKERNETTKIVEQQDIKINKLTESVIEKHDTIIRMNLFRLNGPIYGEYSYADLLDDIHDLQTILAEV